MKMKIDKSVAPFSAAVRLLLFSLLFLSHAVAQAPQPAPSRLTVERIFASNEFQPSGFGGFKWLKDGDSFARLEPSPTIKGSMDLVRYQIETNARDILLPADKLIPKGTTTPLAIHGYDWSTDGNKDLIYTNSQKV